MGVPSKRKPPKTRANIYVSQPSSQVDARTPGGQAGFASARVCVMCERLARSPARRVEAARTCLRLSDLVSACASSSSSSGAAGASPSPPARAASCSGPPPPRTADHVHLAHCTGDKSCQDELNAIGARFGRAAEPRRLASGRRSACLQNGGAGQGRRRRKKRQACGADPARMWLALSHRRFPSLPRLAAAAAAAPVASSLPPRRHRAGCLRRRAGAPDGCRGCAPC